MEALEAISRWLAKQHVVSYCVANDQDMWCANAFYLYCPQAVAFYLLSDPQTRHGQISGGKARVAGTVSGQTKNVALIRGVQFKGELELLEGEASASIRERYNRRFPIARAMSAPVWSIRLDELKFTDNTLGFGKKHIWQR
ncbi:YhbP family protein [Enterobacter sp. Colony194]|uniref:YhbP family protein n=1 Tax=Enterobacter sp. Colony194 TaxID=2866201 RepID=UPI001C6983AA|nr:YhbP family protein [Enterobacter sp. Colony194]